LRGADFSKALISGLLIKNAIVDETTRWPAIKETTDEYFHADVIAASHTIRVVVNYVAEWCGPCKAMAPAVEYVAVSLGGRYKIVKLDVDQNPIVTQEYKIQAMPTLMIFKDGEVAETRVGAFVQKNQLQEWICGTPNARTGRPSDFVDRPPAPEKSRRRKGKRGKWWPFGKDRAS
jgi:thioredoxin 1